MSPTENLCWLLPGARGIARLSYPKAWEPLGPPGTQRWTAMLAGGPLSPWFTGGKGLLVDLLRLGGGPGCMEA